MARIQLKDSGVIFNEEEHTYHLNGKQLSGITDMLQRQLFPSEYDSVPRSAIERAGLYGSTVHSSCQLFDSEWENDGTLEVQDYISLCKENGLVHEFSEYTVTDGDHFASNIDKVYRVNDNTFDLADIKTYGVMNQDKLQKARWQLSVYAYFFELVNPKAKVGRLIILHIRNKARKDGSMDHIKDFIVVDRIPKDIIIELLNAEVEGRQFLNPYSIPHEYAEQEAHIRELLIRKEAIDSELANIKSKFMDTMTLLNITRWNTESGMRITRKLPSTRSSFDPASFRKEYPDLNYDAYYKTSTVAGSLTIAI